MNKFVVCLFLLLYSCSGNKKIVTKPQGGSVSMVLKVFDSNTNKFFEDTLVRRITFYRDSSVIYEVPEIQTSTTIYNDAQITDTKRGIYQFTFLDMKTRSFYDYGTFTNTAKLLRRYTEADTGASFVWKFYNNQVSDEVNNSFPLNDTIIEKVSYKRFTIQRIHTEPSDTVNITLYLDCGRHSMFRFAANFSERIGCPVVMIDELWTGSSKYLWRREIEFHPDSLSPYQHKVFDAWEKYAKKHPVK